MPLTAKQTVAPTIEPVTLDVAKAHCRIDTNDQDSYLTQLITAAREKVENDTNRQLLTATWRMSLDAFPPLLDRSASRLVPFVLRELYRPALGLIDRDTLLLYKSPAIAVTGFTYVDDSGVTQTLAADKYTLDSDSEPARLLPAWGESWPSARNSPNAVQITYTAGYGATADSVPARARHAICLLVAHWYEHREAIGVVGEEIQLTYSNLISSLRVFYPAA